jgi:hypothetical protein
MNTCIFTTHATLDLTHADYSLKTLLALQTIDIVWDNFILYNTHDHELPNEQLVELIKKYDTKNSSKISLFSHITQKKIKRIYFKIFVIVMI